MVVRITVNKILKKAFEKKNTKKGKNPHACLHYQHSITKPNVNTKKVAKALLSFPLKSGV